MKVVHAKVRKYWSISEMLTLETKVAMHVPNPTVRNAASLPNASLIPTALIASTSLVVPVVLRKYARRKKALWTPAMTKRQVLLVAAP